jgi:hypothetical protein
MKNSEIIKKNGYTQKQRDSSNPSITTSLELECCQLQNALLKLEVELIKTDELLEMLRDYIQESYISIFPFNSFPEYPIETI